MLAGFMNQEELSSSTYRTFIKQTCGPRMHPVVSTHLWEVSLSQTNCSDWESLLAGGGPSVFHLQGQVSASCVGVARAGEMLGLDFRFRKGFFVFID